MAVGLSPDNLLKSCPSGILIVISHEHGRLGSTAFRGAGRLASEGPPRTGRFGRTAWVAFRSRSESAARTDGSPTLSGVQDRTLERIRCWRALSLRRVAMPLMQPSAGRFAHK